MQTFEKLDKTSLLGFDRNGLALWDVCLAGGEADTKATVDAEGLSVAVGGAKVPGVTKA